MESGKEFAEVEQAYTAAEAIAEARRCLRCGPCSECAACAPTCDRRHVLVGFGSDTATRPRAWLPLRTTTALAQRFSANGAASDGLASDPIASASTTIEVRRVGVDYVEERCRGCSLCLDVCQFEALALRDAEDPESRVVFDPAACRGCALCAAVCPTAALKPTAHGEGWWESHLAGIFAAPADDTAVEPSVVVACDTRPAAFGAALDDGIVSCRCVGQAHPGMLLELARRGATEITVEACAECRFGGGAALAAQHVDETQALLKALGEDGITVTLLQRPRLGAPADPGEPDSLAAAVWGEGA